MDIILILHSKPLQNYYKYSRSCSKYINTKNTVVKYEKNNKIMGGPGGVAPRKKKSYELKKLHKNFSNLVI